MVPVRTTRPILKEARTDAMREIRKVRISSPVKVGDPVLCNLLGLGVDVIATREVS
jgi:CxxC motif-containing protein